MTARFRLACSAARPGFVTGLTAEAAIARRLGLAEAGGGTPVGAARAALRLVQQGADALISFGLAGGLDPDLAPGALVIPAEIVSDTARFAVCGALAAQFGAVAGALYASPVVLGRAGEKQAIFARTGCQAADMESGAVAEIAAARGLPFAVLRAVCDPAGRDLPPAAMIALDPAGRITVLRVALSVARQPGQIGALLRVAADARAARRSLLDMVRRHAPG